MRQALIFFSIFLLASCSNHKVTKYEYNGVTITRTDNNAKTYFYYGDCDAGYPEHYIKAEYSGFNNGMEAYLIFQPTKEVELIHVMGMFSETVTAKTPLHLKEVNNIQFIDWKESLNDNYNNVVHIVDGLTDNFETEKMLNERYHSKVKAIYPDQSARGK